MAKVKEWADEAAKARKEWDKENGHYRSKAGNLCFCLDCIYFSIDRDHISIGRCGKIKQAFQDQEFTKMGIADDTVSSISVCDNFTNIYGMGFDGKVNKPHLLPAWIKTRKDKKTGEVFAV